MIRRIDQEVLNVVGLPNELQRLLDAVGKRRMIVLLLDGDEARSLATVDSEDHEPGEETDGISIRYAPSRRMIGSGLPATCTSGPSKPGPPGSFTK
jgi:hypothetical protein